jgi:hypothetical protein
MNNSCYGKTMEDVRNRVNVKLVTKKKDMNNLSRKSNFDRVNIFSENLTAAHMRKTCVKLNNPIYNSREKHILCAQIQFSHKANKQIIHLACSVCTVNYYTTMTSFYHIKAKQSADTQPYCTRRIAL